MPLVAKVRGQNAAPRSRQGVNQWHQYGSGEVLGPMLRRTVTFQVWLLFGSLLCGFAQTTMVKPQVKPAQAATIASAATAPQGSEASFEWLIGAGDLLQVSVEGAPDYNKEVRVSPSG